MRNDSRSTSPLPITGAASAPADRRQRARLRDLCDEVLASYRMARQPEQFSEQDRALGKSLVIEIGRRSR